MVAHAVRDRGGEKTLQHPRSGLLVKTVFGVVHGEGAEFAGKMPDVVQQRGDDGDLVLPAPFRERCALEHVLGHGHGLAEILLAAAALEDIPEERDDVVPVEGRDVGRGH